MEWHMSREDEIVKPFPFGHEKWSFGWNGGLGIGRAGVNSVSNWGGETAIRIACAPVLPMRVESIVYRPRRGSDDSGSVRSSPGEEGHCEPLAIRQGHETDIARISVERAGFVLDDGSHRQKALDAVLAGRAPAHHVEEDGSGPRREKCAFIQFPEQMQHGTRRSACNAMLAACPFFQ